MKRIPFIIMLSAVIFLIGCGVNNPAATQQAQAIVFLHSASGTHKNNVDINFGNWGESSIVHGATGSLIAVSSTWNPKGHIVCWDLDSHQIISDNVLNLNFISVVQKNNVYYLYGQNGTNTCYTLSMASSSDLITWSAPQVVYTNNKYVFNTSVVSYKNGLYLMALEFEASPGIYNFRFLTSPDMMNWTSIGAPSYYQASYAGCPELIYDAQYDKVYVLWGKWITIANGSSWDATFISRSINLTNDWETGTGYPGNVQGDCYVPFSAMDGVGEGVNNSDIAVANDPITGNARFIYLTGNQIDTFALRDAIWPYGDAVNYCRSFFVTP